MQFLPPECTRMASIGVCPRKTGAAKPSAQTPAPVPPSTAQLFGLPGGLV